MWHFIPQHVVQDAADHNKLLYSLGFNIDCSEEDPEPLCQHPKGIFNDPPGSAQPIIEVPGRRVQ